MIDSCIAEPRLQKGMARHVERCAPATKSVMARTSLASQPPATSSKYPGIAPRADIISRASRADNKNDNDGGLGSAGSWAQMEEDA